MTLTRVGLVAIELPVGRNLQGELLDALQRPFSAAVEGNVKLSLARHANIDLVPFFQFQRIDHVRRQADGQAIAPSRNLHGTSYRYTIIMYIQTPACQAAAGTIPGLGSMGRSLSRPKSFSYSDAACRSAAS